MRVAVLQQMNFDNLIARDRVITAYSCTFVAPLVCLSPYVAHLLELNSSENSKVNCAVNRPGNARANWAERLPQTPTIVGRFKVAMTGSEQGFGWAI